MESVVEKTTLPVRIQSDAQYNAFKHEYNAANDDFAAGRPYDEERQRQIIHLLWAYYPPERLHALTPTFAIQDEAEFEILMAEFKALGDPDLGTPEQARYEILLPALTAYEAEHYTINTDDLDAIDIIQARMDALGLQQKDLAPLLGGQNRASEVLSRKRPLTIKMMRALHDGLGISYDDLMRETEKA
jgi:HTH-type transcriptional regulator / antitoxin HigA